MADFLTGQLADDLVKTSIDLCGRKQDKCAKFPKYLYPTYVDMIMNVSLNIQKSIYIANETYDKNDRFKLQREAIVCNKIDFLGFTYHITESGKIVMQIVKSKKVTKHRQLKKMLKDFDGKKITADEFAQSYTGWRAHVLRGNCKSLVKKWDDWLGGEFERRGYVLNKNGRRITICEH